MGHRAAHGALTVRRTHLQLDDGDTGAYVLLPGDPGRCALIAERLDNARHVATHREYTTYTGALDGATVSVTSTGIGGPSAAIAVEELHSLGAHTLLRVGTCGSMREKIGEGDVVIAQAAARDDGASAHYLPAGMPAVAHLDVVLALRDAAVALHVPHSVGVVVSTDSFYAQRDPETLPVGDDLVQRWHAWRRSGCVAAEMETATLLSVATVRGMRAGSVLAVIDRIAPVLTPMPPPDHLPLQWTIDVAVDAMRRLIAADTFQRLAAASAP